MIAKDVHKMNGKHDEMGQKEQIDSVKEEMTID